MKIAFDVGGPLENSTLFELTSKVDQDHGVIVGTLHSSKGTENDVIILAEANQIEQRRLFYVGATRARDKLVITFTGDSALVNDFKHCYQTLYDLGQQDFLKFRGLD